MNTDKSKITGAFKELGKKGYFCRQSFWCCQSCGCAAVPDEAKNKFVFYHKQDADSIKSGILVREMYLTHGEGGDGYEIVSILKKHGLNAEWNGNNATRILIKPSKE